MSLKLFLVILNIPESFVGKIKNKIDEILNNFHLGKIDLIEVRKQLLILYGVMLPKGTLCGCDKRKAFPMENLTDWYCTNCGREIKHNAT